MKLPPPRARLIGGPYTPPRVRVPEHLVDEADREVTVLRWSDAPIPWPLAKHRGIGGKLAPLLVGDLVRAVQTESLHAVAHHWGVSFWTVNRWRGLLGVPRFTPGTKRLWARTRAERCGR